MMKQPQLYEKYRPSMKDPEHPFAEVVGQDKAVRQVERILDREGWGGQAFFISGPSGVGKTTIGRIVAGIGADERCIDEYDSADTLTMEEMDRLNRVLGMYGWGKKSGRAIIVNECHALRGAAIRRLLGLLERIPRHVVWIFTTTKEGENTLFEKQIDASPLLSRCHEIHLTGQGLCKPFALLAQRIARAEGLDGKDLPAYENLLKEDHNNLRRALMAIADGRMKE